MSLSLSKSAAALLGEGKILATRLADTLMAAKSLEKAAAPAKMTYIRTEALYELYRLLRNYDAARAERRSGLSSCHHSLIRNTRLSSPIPTMSENTLRWQPGPRTSYETAYEAFVSERYAETQDICSEAAGIFPDDDLLPKFMLLDAMATGALAGEIAYKEKLDSLMARYPATPEGKRAAEITDFLRKGDPRTTDC